MPIARTFLTASLLAALAVSAGRYGGAALARGNADGDEGGVGGIGPDVVTGGFIDIGKFGSVGGISAYALGTISCNVGDQPVLWCDSFIPNLCNATQHPVIAQNLYRLKDGVLEQIGMSWVKHGVCALSDSYCASCQEEGWGCHALGVGCSDPYDASLNGGQTNLGPRSQVNAATGAVIYPYSAPPAPPTIGRRIQVRTDDLKPSLNPGALYFGEAIYIAGDDAAWGNDDNNASHRQVQVGPWQTNGYVLDFVGPTEQQKPAILAWRDNGLGLGIPDPSVLLAKASVAGDGLFHVASKATDQGNGIWRYDYAIMNLNSDRSAGRFVVPLPQGLPVLWSGQHVIDHHSGEPYETGPWETLVSTDAIEWRTTPHAEQPMANALRWGTMFNFRLEIKAAPTQGIATIGLFKPGAAPDPQVVVVVPMAATDLAADLDGDGTVDGADLGILLSAWGTRGPGDLDESGAVDGADLGILLANFGG